jgi:hypothetical protein
VERCHAGGGDDKTISIKYVAGKIPKTMPSPTCNSRDADESLSKGAHKDFLLRNNTAAESPKAIQHGAVDKTTAAI